MSNYTRFKDVTCPWGRENGEERYLRQLTDTFWVSVLYRLTGFGYWEWETVIVRVREDGDPLKFARGAWDDRELLTVRGDHRDALDDITESEIMEWYAEHSGERNSFETVLEAIKGN